MPAAHTITISVPVAMGREMARTAKQEYRTVSELLREAFRQYQARRNLHRLARAGRKAVKAQRLRPEDIGGPFEA